MAKTIDQLTALGATPNDSDNLVIDDSGVTKKVTAGQLKGDCFRVQQNNGLSSTIGTRIGTNANQLLGFWNATPVDQPALTADLLDSLQEVGLIASGAGDTPLNLTGGALGCGTITLTDAANIAAQTGTGTKIGTATSQKIGFWNVTPVVQPAGANQAALTDSTGGTAGSSLVAAGGSYTAANINNNFATLNRLVAEIRTALVNTGIIKGAA
jgi:hypothetical protein